MAKRKTPKILKVEKTLIKCCLILFLLFPILNVVSKAALSNMNLEVEKQKREVNIQEKRVESLTMKVNELKSLANLQDIIESEGLSYNSSKVKVISNN